MTKIGQKIIRILGEFSPDIPLRGLSGVLVTTHLFFLKCTYTRRQMFMMSKESKHALFKFLGFSSVLVSQIIALRPQFRLGSLLINALA